MGQSLSGGGKSHEVQKKLHDRARVGEGKRETLITLRKKGKKKKVSTKNRYFGAGKKLEVTENEKK